MPRIKDSFRIFTLLVAILIGYMFQAPGADARPEVVRLVPFASQARISVTPLTGGDGQDAIVHPASPLPHS